MTSLVALAGAALLWTAGFEAYRRQQLSVSELARLKREQSERAELLEDNRRAAAGLASAKMGSGKMPIETAAALRLKLAKLQLLAHNLTAQDAGRGEPKPALVWPSGSEVMAAENWKWVGNSSAADCIQSVLWSATQGDVDRLAGVISLEGSARNEAQTFFDRLPEAAREQYGRPEKVLATMIAANMPNNLTAVAVVDEAGDDQVSIVTLRIADADAQEADLKLREENTPSGWKLDVPERILEQFELQLRRGPDVSGDASR